MDQQAQEGMFEGGPGPDESTTSNRQHAQKLLVDLDDMERRYVQGLEESRGLHMQGQVKNRRKLLKDKLFS
jgi:hypothetical protein